MAKSSAKLIWGRWAAHLYERQVKARDLYSRMMRTLAETGNGWMTFKDSCNEKSNQTKRPQNAIHLSNLCTEITEVTSASETAVCNLGSINLARHVTNGRFDFEKLANTVARAVPFLDRVIDINFYPTATAQASNRRWRPVGLGIMGVQDVSSSSDYRLTRMPHEIYPCAFRRRSTTVHWWLLAI